MIRVKRRGAEDANLLQGCPVRALGEYGIFRLSETLLLAF